MITAHTDIHKERHITQESITFAFGFRPAAAFTEDIDALTVRCRETTHVFHNAQDRYLHLFSSQMPRRTTPMEASCGVVTTTPPVKGTVWQSDN